MTRNKTRSKRGKKRNDQEEEIRGFRNIKKDKKPPKRINLTDLNDEYPNFDSDEFFNNMGHYNDE
ncbi:MAG TPA: hypothetical protein ENK25_05285 [Bacteroidetes bacterium]|nr:hypothetical protein [Bacteroidota bacterium]